MGDLRFGEVDEHQLVASVADLVHDVAVHVGAALHIGAREVHVPRYSVHLGVLWCEIRQRSSM